jgi:hypothetical protein
MYLYLRSVRGVLCLCCFFARFFWFWLFVFQIRQIDLSKNVNRAANFTTTTTTTTTRPTTGAEEKKDDNSPRK